MRADKRATTLQTVCNRLQRRAAACRASSLRGCRPRRSPSPHEAPLARAGGPTRLLMGPSGQ
eukprot:11540988-Alexandrium_andersonii.AAC.1